MTAMGRLWLGIPGSEVLLSPMGRRLSENPIEVSTEERTASGRLVIDIRARKMRFGLSYSTVTDEILEQLKGIYNLGGTLSLLVERKDLSVDQYFVRFKPFARARYLTGGDWLWQNISVVLEEI